jgi:hypothetical protein
MPGHEIVIASAAVSTQAYLSLPHLYAYLNTARLLTGAMASTSDLDEQIERLR